MAKKIHSIRFQIIRTNLQAALLTGVFFFVGLQLFLLFLPSNTLSLSMILWLTGYVFLISAFAGIYKGYQGSQSIKDRLEKISTSITVLSRGNYQGRCKVEGHDEIGRMANDLNVLAGNIQAQVRSLQRMADEKEELASKAHQAAVIEERQRLARDLHDAVSQQLFALSMVTSAALRLYDRDPRLAREQLEQISEMAGQAQVEMRALLLHLRPVHLTGETLEQGVEKLIEELRRKCSIDFHVRITELPPLSKATENHLFRMIQEALSNILRHAEATVVTIDLHQKSRNLSLSIRDDGKGFDLNKEKKTSYGLRTIRERCEEIGGVFRIRSIENEGTYIDMRIPVKEATEGE